MLINHELPKHLLYKSNIYNNYDFLLPHFYLQDEYYRDFFIRQSKNRRFIIMDCGLFEGEIPSNSKLIEMIDEIKPNYFIIPDAWNDSTQTLKNAKYWINVLIKELPRKTELMSVIQAKTKNEAINSYHRLYDLGYRGIAINHSGEYLSTLGNLSKNELINKTWGRIEFVSLLQQLSSFDKNIHFHLLGTNLPWEFEYYSKSYIKSIDTSNPVLFGLEFGKYNENLKLIETKPSKKLEHYYNLEFTEEQILNIEYNINKFKQQFYG